MLPKQPSLAGLPPVISSPLPQEGNALKLKGTEKKTKTQKWVK